jgi:hypothetical protein
MLYTNDNSNAGKYDISIVAVINNMNGTSIESTPTAFSITVTKKTTNTTNNSTVDGEDSTDDLLYGGYSESFKYGKN